MKIAIINFSSSTYHFFDLIICNLKSAVETDSEIERQRLLVTTRNILEMFIETFEYHKQEISTIPQIAGNLHT